MPGKPVLGKKTCIYRADLAEATQRMARPRSAQHTADELIRATDAYAHISLATYDRTVGVIKVAGACRDPSLTGQRHDRFQKDVDAIGTLLLGRPLPGVMADALVLSGHEDHGGRADPRPFLGVVSGARHEPGVTEPAVGRGLGDHLLDGSVEGDAGRPRRRTPVDPNPVRFGEVGPV